MWRAIADESNPGLCQDVRTSPAWSVHLLKIDRKRQSKRPKQKGKVVMLRWNINIVKSIRAGLIWLPPFQGCFCSRRKSEEIIVWEALAGQGDPFFTSGAKKLSQKVSLDWAWSLVQQLPWLFIIYVTLHRSIPLREACTNIELKKRPPGLQLHHVQPREMIESKSHRGWQGWAYHKQPLDFFLQETASFSDTISQRLEAVP